MTRYLGMGRSNVFVLIEDGGRRSLQKRSDVCSHPPSTFAWGTDGTGAVELAVALLTDAVDATTARDHHQEFVDDIVSNLPSTWSLTREEILAWVALQSDDTEADDEQEVVA